MYCTDCGSRNPADSKYCRECGRKILSLEDAAKLSPNRASNSLNIDQPHEESSEPERLRHLLDMAFWHNEVGNTPSAILACEAALKVDSYSTTALSLLGVLYEKQGNDAKAIEVFQRVVELNPESAADIAKLEHLLRGIRDKAVNPSLVHQLAPPVLLKAARRYPNMPMIAVAVMVALLLGCGLKAVWDKYVPVTAPTNEPVTSIAGINPTIKSQANYDTNPREPIAPVAVASNGYPYPTSAPVTQPPQYHDPFTVQDPSLLEQIARSHSGGGSDNPDRRPDSGYYQQPAFDMPSVSSLRPLAVSAPPTPQHMVPVDGSGPTNDHVVMVDPQSAPATSNSDGSTSDSGDPPASHIFINVHGDSSSAGATGATPVPVDNHLHSISLRENAGASLQQKGLNLQESGNYKAAEATYDSAIAAYQQDIANGRNTEEAKRGIDACNVAVEICKQSQ